MFSKFIWCSLSFSFSLFFFRFIIHLLIGIRSFLFPPFFNLSSSLILTFLSSVVCIFLFFLHSSDSVGFLSLHFLFIFSSFSSFTCFHFIFLFCSFLSSSSSTTAIVVASHPSAPCRFLFSSSSFYFSIFFYAYRFLASLFLFLLIFLFSSYFFLCFDASRRPPLRSAPVVVVGSSEVSVSLFSHWLFGHSGCWPAIPTISLPPVTPSLSPAPSRYLAVCVFVSVSCRIAVAGVIRLHCFCPSLSPAGSSSSDLSSADVIDG